MQHRCHRRVFCGLVQHADAGALCAVLFVLQTRAVSEKVIVLCALGRVTPPYAHRTARPTHIASFHSLRMTAVEHRAHTRSSSSSSTGSPSEVCYFSQPTYRIEAVCLPVFFKFLEFDFHFKTKNCDMSFRMLF